MKIALISPLPPPEGGIATWTKEAEGFFLNNAIQFEIIDNAVVGKRKEKITSTTRLKDEIIRTISIIKKLKHTISSFKPDILHINTSCGRFGIYRDYLCMIFARASHIPCVLHCHCNVADQLHDSIAESFFKRMVKMSATVFVLNRSTSDYVENKTSITPILMPNFIEIDKNKTVHRAINERMREVLFVGHIQKTKGCFEIVEAARRFPDLRFTLVGPIGIEFSQLKLPPNVSMVGKKKHDDVKRYMDDADAFIFPSYTEGFSNALLEAMYSGLPVIASDVGANRDMIEDKGGIIVPVKNVEKIAEALDFFSAAEIRRKMSGWNINKVERSYSKERVMGKIVDIYTEILTKSN